MGQATGTASCFRCLLVLVTVTAGSAALVALPAPDLLALGTGIRSGAWAGDPFDEVLVEVCEVAVTGCAVWLWLATAVVAGDAARGRTSRHRGVPDAVRRVVLVACGVALVGALGAPAHAARRGRGVARGGTAPARPGDHDDAREPGVRPGGVTPPPPGTPARRQPAVVVVQPGDTCGPSPGPTSRRAPATSAVAGRVREIHRANRAVIGTDPDLIRPHQRLLMPRPTTIREEHR